MAKSSLEVRYKNMHQFKVQKPVSGLALLR